MKSYKRRESHAYPYFKLAAWDNRSFTWRDGKTALGTEEAARREARKPGQYRISRIEVSGRIDLAPFTI